MPLYLIYLLLTLLIVSCKSRSTPSEEKNLEFVGPNTFENFWTVDYKTESYLCRADCNPIALDLNPSVSSAVIKRAACIDLASKQGYLSQVPLALVKDYLPSETLSELAKPRTKSIDVSGGDETYTMLMQALDPKVNLRLRFLGEDVGEAEADRRRVAREICLGKEQSFEQAKGRVEIPKPRPALTQSKDPFVNILLSDPNFSKRVDELRFITLPCEDDDRERMTEKCRSFFRRWLERSFHLTSLPSKYTAKIFESKIAVTVTDKGEAPGLFSFGKPCKGYASVASPHNPGEISYAPYEIQALFDDQKIRSFLNPAREIPVSQRLWILTTVSNEQGQFVFALGFRGQVGEFAKR